MNGTYFTRLTPITFPFLAIVKAKETGGTDATFTELEDSVHTANATLDFSPPNLLGDDSVGPAAKNNYLFEKVEPELHHKSSPKGTRGFAVGRVNSEDTGSLFFSLCVNVFYTISTNMMHAVTILATR